MAVTPALAWAGTFAAPTAGAYRLAFVTSGTIAATSSDIATYNAFVTSEAALSDALPTTSWTAIASTAGAGVSTSIARTQEFLAAAGTDAIANTACSVAGCASDPIYLVDGTELASSLANFFADNLLSTNAITVDQSGNPFSGYVWTGSNADGTAAAGDTLGSTNPQFGTPSFFGNGLDFANFLSATTTMSLYAISAPIDSSTNVPEPASAALLVTGALALVAARRRRGVSRV